MATVSHPPFDSPRQRWNEEEDGVYTLNRGDLAAERRRLEWNHHNIWLPVCDGQLCPPEILAHLRDLPSPRVAEVATGTGVWLRELAAQLPASAELRGIDMDATKFPPASELPPNMSMTKHNALRPFPEDMRGTFDVVHVRLIVLGMKKGDWEVVAEHLHTLLRPGGYLLWAEVGDIMKCVPPSTVFDEWMRVTALWAMKTGRDMYMPARLPAVLKDAGFKDVNSRLFHTFAAKDMLREAMAHPAVNVVRPVMLGVLEDGGVEGMRSMKDLEAMEEAMGREIKEKGLLMGLQYNWFWGRT
ncbi:N-methyltransferase tcpN [Colletotrichum sidae]|uniref:N-methyltransferase tcpN n=1 Tax=Colletotrichum sidae TaxID=1347389 RepID=A0A4R8TM08_9PEZI|nr:N-methyltransferase tcpN [Colletotrichum sidae]